MRRFFGGKGKPVPLLAAILFITLICAGMFAASVVSCLEAHESNLGCMRWLDSVVGLLKRGYPTIKQNYSGFVTIIFAGVYLIIGLVVVLSALKGRKVSVRVCLALAVALLGEYLVLSKQTSLGAAVTVVAPFIVALILHNFYRQDHARDPYLEPVSMPEALSVIGAFALLLATQFFYLNYIPKDWDTEACSYRFIYWTSWSGVLLHEAGYHPQTSLGMLWNAIMTALGHTDEPDRYYLFIRFASSAVAALKFILFFFLTRYICGTFAAFLGLAILGFGPPENWWSRQPFMHQLPGLVAIPLLWCWIAAWRSPTWVRFGLLSIAICLTRFVYPSGMFMGFGPPIFFAGLVVFSSRQWLQHLPKMMLMVFGVGFWLLWRSIAAWIQWGSFRLLAPLAVPSEFKPASVYDRFSTLLDNARDIFVSTFLHQVHPTHWTVPLTLPPERCLTSIVIVLMLFALGRMVTGRAGALGALLIIALVMTLLPSLSTEVAARRLGVTFLIFTLIAVREAEYLVRILRSDGNVLLASALSRVLPVIVGAYLLWIGSAAQFSANPALPHQVVRGRIMRGELQDDALVVFLSGIGNCDLFYSVYKDLKSRNCRTGWVYADYHGSPDTYTLIDAPAVKADSWVYKQTEMQTCLNQHKDKSWRKIIFMVSDSRESKDIIERLKLRYPSAPFYYKMDAVHSSIGVFVMTVNNAD